VILNARPGQMRAQTRASFTRSMRLCARAGLWSWPIWGPPGPVKGGDDGPPTVSG
jgi:hypothetical protein